MKSRRRLSIFSQIGIALVFSTLVLYPYMIKPAYAAALVNNTCQSAATNASTRSCALTVANTGDVIIVMVTIFTDSASCPPALFSNSTGGSESFTFIANTGCQNQVSFGGQQAFASKFTATSNSVHTIVVTLASNPGVNGYLAVTGYDTSGAPNARIGTATGSGTAGSATVLLGTSTSVNYADPSILIAGIISGVTENTFTPGSGFTSISTHFSLCDQADNQYSTSSSVTSPSNFPWTDTTNISCTTGPWLELGIVIGTGASQGTTNLGSCPTKNTATFTMANLTEYFYTASSLQNEVINTISVEVASVNSGHSASEQMYLVIYSTGSSGSISASNTFILAAQKFFLLSPTATPQLITWNAGYNQNFIPAGATIGIGIIGNSKILINQSSLSGMFTGASGAVPGGGTTGIPAAQYTSLTSVGTELYLCANVTFQSVVTTTITSTLTNTTTATSTTTITSINPGSNTNLPIVLLILFLPAMLALAITRNLSGFLGGLLLGAVVLTSAGIISPFILTGLIIAVVALAFVISRGGPNG